MCPTKVAPSPFGAVAVVCMCSLRYTMPLNIRLGPPTSRDGTQEDQERIPSCDSKQIIRSHRSNPRAEGGEPALLVLALSMPP